VPGSVYSGIGTMDVSSLFPLLGGDGARFLKEYLVLLFPSRSDVTVKIAELVPFCFFFFSGSIQQVVLGDVPEPPSSWPERELFKVMEFPFPFFSPLDCCQQRIWTGCRLRFFPAAAVERILFFPA